MIIDCDDCALRDLACDDCVVQVLLGPARSLGFAERTALAVLADGGLVPPLRMIPGRPAAQPAGQAPGSRPAGRGRAAPA